MNFIENLDTAMETLYKKGAFLTTQKDGKTNTMTISWGHIGFCWGKPIFTVMVRQSRYTKSFLDASGEFTVNIPTSADFKDALMFCGKHSGRDVDKILECNIKTAPSNKLDTPVIAGAGYTYECKIVGTSTMSPELFDKDILDTQYKDGDMHTFYYGEIVDCYIK